MISHQKVKNIRHETKKKIVYITLLFQGLGKRFFKDKSQHVTQFAFHETKQDGETSDLKTSYNDSISSQTKTLPNVQQTLNFRRFPRVYPRPLLSSNYNPVSYTHLTLPTICSV